MIAGRASVAGRSRAARNGSAARAGRLALPVALFLVTLVLPFIFTLGSLRLSAYRIVLVVAIVPLLFAWLGGRAGRIRVADLALLALCLWTAVSYGALHGAGTATEAGGIFFVETMGAYLLARVCIRSADDFFRMARVLFWIVMFLAPFAVLEAITHRNILLETLNRIWPSYHVFSKEPRWGLQRVQSVFEHQILFGVFCGSAIGLTWMVLGRGRPLAARVLRTGLVLLTAGLSLSSGALTGMVVQLLLIGWNAALASFRARWVLLAGLVAGAWIFLEVAADRPPAVIFINYFSFDAHSAYMRLHQWNFTTGEIARHPLLGIGMNDWERPSWMRESVDMFWVVFGLRHGVPALAATFLAFFAVAVPLILRRGLDARQADYRLGILFCLAGFFLAGWTVHFWNATYALFVFLLGSGIWLLDASPEAAPASPDDERERRVRRRRAAGQPQPGLEHRPVPGTPGYRPVAQIGSSLPRAARDRPRML